MKLKKILKNLKKIQIMNNKLWLNRLFYFLCILMIGIGVYFANLSKSEKRPQIDNVEYITYNHNNISYSVDLIYTGEITKNNLIEICNEFNKEYDAVVVKIYSSKDGYSALKNNVFNDAFYSDYLLFYVKNNTGEGAYKGFNEIRWMQEKGALGDLFGLKHKLTNE